ncbi:hypothetical protein diail_7214 [Diaporthe ilicicola]|nr:hypothetical protein diail_7214 [Diaporthe ilicicola]
MQQTPARVAKAGGGTPAPYGHACTNCVRAKCKCMYGDHAGACERCFRLHKDCQPSVPNRKRTQKKAPGSRTAHLEEKLDDLVSLIRSQTAVKGHDESPPIRTPGSLGQSGSDATALPSLSSTSSPNTTVNTSNPNRPWNTTTARTNTSATAADAQLDYYVPDNEAEERLDLFRRDFPPFGPVVYIPPTMTAKELRRTRPLLWIAVMACTTRSTKEAHLIGDKIRHIVSEKVVRQYERSLDLLQGLLVFLCWPHSHKKENPFISIWTGIGVSIAHDLGLTAFKAETPFTFMKKASQMLRRDNNLRWTPHMEESLRLLIDQPECEGDRTLAVQVRCALILEQLNDLLIQQAIWRTLPSPIDPSRNDAILLHLYATEVVINELALQLPPSTSHSDVTARLERLQKCLKAIENWFDAWERTPPSLALGGTFHLFVQLVHCLVTVIKLSRLDDDFPAWDAAGARRRLDIFSLFDRVSARMNTIRTAVGILEDDEREESIWEKSAIFMRLMRAGVQADWEGSGDENTEPAAGGAQPLDNRLALTTGNDGGVMGANLPINQDALTGEFVTNFGDDPWLSAIFIPWDTMNF